MKFRQTILGVASAALLHCAPALAQSAAGDADWACWYPGAGKLNCLLLKAATPPASAAAPKAGLETVDAGTVQRGRMLPLSARKIQLAGAELLGEIVEIPMMNEPEDMLLVQQLAQVSVCGTALNCRVTFLASAADVILLRDELTGELN